MIKKFYYLKKINILLKIDILNSFYYDIWFDESKNKFIRNIMKDQSYSVILQFFIAGLNF